MVKVKKSKTTIFLMQESRLEKNIETMKSMLKTGYNDDKLKFDIQKAKLARYGEKKIEYELRHSTIGMYVLHDVNFIDEDNEAQIDYVIITPSYCYLVECKSLLGNVSIGKQGQFTIEYEYQKQTIKEGIYSPYTKVKINVSTIKNMWLKKNWGLTNNLFEKPFDNYYRPLVVLSNPLGTLKKDYAPEQVRRIVIRVDELIPYLEKEEEKKKEIEKYTQKQMLNTTQNIMKYHSNKENTEWLKRYEKDDSDVKGEYFSNRNEELKEKLKIYRQRKRKKKNVPVFYIFTNEELKKLVKEKPKSVEELEELNILTPVRVKLYGEEITDIIRSVWK